MDLAIRAIAVLVVSLISLLGSSLPLFFTTPATIPLLARASPVAAGIMFGTALCHLLPDALDAFNDPSLPSTSQPWGDYPLAETLALAGGFLMLLIDILSGGHSHSHSHNPSSCDNHLCRASAPLSESTSLIPNTNNDDPDKAGGNKSNKLHKLRAMEFAIATHSIIIGLTAGSLTSVSAFLASTLALCFHQFFEGLALGVAASESAATPKERLAVVLLFSTCCGGGIAVCAAFSSIENDVPGDGDGTADLVEGCLNAVGAGMLLVIATEFTGKGGEKESFIMMAIGAAAMAILAVWA